MICNSRSNVCRLVKISPHKCAVYVISDEKLIKAQETAKAAGNGIHASDASQRVRQIIWDIENPRQLVDRMQGKPIPAVIENVRDGSTVHAFLLPDFYHITLMMSGVKV